MRDYYRTGTLNPLEFIGFLFIAGIVVVLFLLFTKDGAKRRASSLDKPANKPKHNSDGTSITNEVDPSFWTPLTDGERYRANSLWGNNGLKFRRWCHETVNTFKWIFIVGIVILIISLISN
jgi:hypothetical protein